VAVDALGPLLAALITAASVQDRDAAKPLLWNVRQAFPSIELAWADGGYASKVAERFVHQGLLGADYGQHDLRQAINDMNQPIRYAASLRNLAITILRLTGKPGSPPPYATTPAAWQTNANDHELLTSDFAGAC
jgi:hypothetical protein